MQPTEADRKRAKRLATVATLIVAPVVGIGWAILGVALYYEGGGSLGDANSPGETDHAWWVAPAIVLAAVAALAAIIVTTRAVYRWELRQSAGR